METKLKTNLETNRQTKLEIKLEPVIDSESFVLADIHQSHASSSLENVEVDEEGSQKLSGLHVLLVEDVLMNQWLAQSSWNRMVLQ